jgi:hypothetical protein
MNAVHTFPPYFPKTHSNIILPSTPRSREWSLPFRLVTPPQQAKVLVVALLRAPIRPPLWPIKHLGGKCRTVKHPQSKSSAIGKLRGCIQKFPDWVDNKIYAYNNKNSFRRNTKGYGVKTHYTDSQNSDTTASSSRELYHLHFSLQVASPETFGYTLVTRVESVLVNEIMFSSIQA